MGNLTKSDSALLDKLVGDCIAYSLKPNESLEYIKKEYGVIDERTYFRRRKKLLSEETTNAWYSHFCRFGFIELHKKLVNGLENCLDDSLKILHEEKNKPKPDIYLILKLQKCIRETTLTLSELSQGSPVMAALMWKLRGGVFGSERLYTYDYNNLNFKNNNNNNNLPLPDKDNDQDHQENQ